MYVTVNNQSISNEMYMTVTIESLRFQIFFVLCQLR